MTLSNRPTYAPDRRPGDPADVLGDPSDLVVFVTTIRDAETLASLLEAGAAALKYAPAGSVTNALFRRQDVRLGAQAAKALRSEARRAHDRNEDRHRARARADAAETRRRRKEASTP